METNNAVNWSKGHNGANITIAMFLIVCTNVPGGMVPGGSTRQSLKKPKEVRPKGTVNLLQIFMELDDHFLMASKSAHDSSKMLEVSRLHYHSNFADNQRHIDHSTRGSMRCSTIWHNNLTLMANGVLSPFISGLTKVISTFTLSRHMINTMPSVCLLVSDCNTCAINFILGNTHIVSPIYFLGYLFTNTIGS